jgi:hypothetical protein
VARGNPRSPRSTYVWWLAALCIIKKIVEISIEFCDINCFGLQVRKYDFGQKVSSNLIYQRHYTSKRTKSRLCNKLCCRLVERGGGPGYLSGRLSENNINVRVQI